VEPQPAARLTLLSQALRNHTSQFARVTSDNIGALSYGAAPVARYTGKFEYVPSEAVDLIGDGLIKYAPR
jgi:hypothetical protein